MPPPSHFQKSSYAYLRVENEHFTCGPGWTPHYTPASPSPCSLMHCFGGIKVPWIILDEHSDLSILATRRFLKARALYMRKYLGSIEDNNQSENLIIPNTRPCGVCLWPPKRAPLICTHQSSWGALYTLITPEFKLFPTGLLLRSLN